MRFLTNGVVERLRAAVCASLLAAAAAVVASGEEAVTPPAAPLETVAPEVVCLFENSVITYARRPQMKTSQFVFWRTRDEIRRQRIDGTEANYWRRHPDGTVSFHRLLPEHKRVVDYNEGDLKALQSLQSWEDLATFAEVRDLIGRLERDGEVEVREIGRTAERYIGQVDGVDIEIHWLPEEQVPALFRRGFPARLVTLRLVELATPGEAQWQRISDASFARYDYADIGDFEDDPVFGYLHAEHEHAHGH